MLFCLSPPPPEPIKLRLAFFSSDRANVYLAAIKSFVDAVNGEAKGLIDIEVYFSGALIRKHSGEWTAERVIKNFDVVNVQMMEQLKSDPKRTVVIPSKSDMERADAAFVAVTDEAMDKSPHSRELLRVAKSEIAKLRASE